MSCNKLILIILDYSINLHARYSKAKLTNFIFSYFLIRFVFSQEINKYKYVKLIMSITLGYVTCIVIKMKRFTSL